MVTVVVIVRASLKTSSHAYTRFLSSPALAIAAASVKNGLSLVPPLLSAPIDPTKTPQPSATGPAASLGMHSFGVEPPVPAVPAVPVLVLSLPAVPAAPPDPPWPQKNRLQSPWTL